MRRERASSSEANEASSIKGKIESEHRRGSVEPRRVKRTEEVARMLATDEAGEARDDRRTTRSDGRS